MNQFLEEAFQKAITIEKRSLNFYHRMSARVKDEGARRMFEHLAKEETEHLIAFCKVYPGNPLCLLNILNRADDFDEPAYCSLMVAADGGINEKEALEISLREEQACIDSYSMFTGVINEPQLHEVFARALRDTHRHREMISDEYRRLMGMVDSSDQDTYVRE
jgi:rubrerythrin